MRQDHPLAPWVVQYAGQVVTRSVVGDDGLTAWRRTHGKLKLPRPLCPWGEKIFFIEGGAKAKASTPGPKWLPGVFLALAESTEEYIVGTPTGCVRTTAMKRLPREEAADIGLFNAVEGTPERPDPHAPGGAGGGRGEGLRAHLAARLPEGLPPPATGGGAPGPRRVYIRAGVELVKYGRTEGCAGCATAAAGETGRSHSEMCRLRIEEAMKADTGGAIRVEAAERKLSVTGGKRAKRAADTDPEALEYDAAQPEGAAVSQEDTQMTPAAASSSSSNSRPVAAPVAAPRPVAAPVAAPATVAAPVAAPATVAAPVTAGKAVN